MMNRALDQPCDELCVTNYKLFSVYLIQKNPNCFNDPIDTTDNLEPEPQTILTFYSQSMNHTLFFHSDLRSST